MPYNKDKRNIVFSLMLLLPLLLFISSCDSKRVYEAYKPVKGGAWQYNEPVSFSVDIKDTAQRYNLYISVRHSFNFDWRNIWVKIKTQYPDGKTEESSVNLPLSEADGKWFGKCSGDNCDLRVLIQQHAIFPKEGKYTFTITQDMRQNPLPKINEIGFRVEKWVKGE
jgi:gliding motility-associated lipoprotein GldH